MKMTSAACFASAAVLVTACGGGGGGGGGDDGIDYSGKTTPATISDNAGAVQLSSTALSSAQDQYLDVNDYVPTSAEKPSMLKLVAGAMVTRDDQCGGSSSAESTDTSFSVVFDNYHPDGPDMGAPECNDDFYLNGGISGTWSSGADYEQAAVTFDAFELTMVPHTFGYDGTMAVKEYLDYSVVTSNFVASYNGIGTFKAEDFTVKVDEYGNILAVSGKYYLRDDGYLVFETTTELDYSAGCADFQPNGGVFEITSAEGVWTIDAGTAYANPSYGCGYALVTPPAGHGDPSYVSLSGV